MYACMHDFFMYNLSQNIITHFDSIGFCSFVL